MENRLNDSKWLVSAKDFRCFQAVSCDLALSYSYTVSAQSSVLQLGRLKSYLNAKYIVLAFSSVGTGSYD